MTRNRASAKKAGTSFETLIVGYLQAKLDDRIERRRLSGSKDRGDISGIRFMGQRVVAECKNTSRIDLGTWANETEIQRLNDDAGVGLIVHKRHGKGAAEDQWVTLTLADLVSLMTGVRP